jgi:trk system potassium uptake protein
MRQIAIIGLGNFGYYLGRELYNKGFDVLGVDNKQDAVQKAKNDFSEAVIADATDKETLLALGMDQADLAVVTIGTNMLASILATFNLKEIGIKRVLAKALSEEHGQILSRMGADEILFPEKDLAVTLAQRIENPNLLEYLPTIEDYGMFELTSFPEITGKSLRELDLINQYGIQVIAVRNQQSKRMAFIPGADYVISENDVAILLSSNQSMAQLLKDIEHGTLKRRK